MLEDWIYQYLPATFCVLAFLVNPFFIYLIFTEDPTKFGNYRYLLLSFSIFNMVYSILNVLVPIDIHTYSYCMFLIIKRGWFVERSDLHFHLLLIRCSMLGGSYGILLIHFIYRYLVIHNSSLTKKYFYIYMLGSFITFAFYYFYWYATCYFLGQAGPEMKQYVSEDFAIVYGENSTNFNMVGVIYHKGVAYITKVRSWLTVFLCSFLSVASIIAFVFFARLVMKKLNQASTSIKTSTFQFELLRALIVQTLIPIVISFSPCLLCWYSPIFGIQFARGFNYFEVSALSVFSFVDPVAIILCLPIFRVRVLKLWKPVSSITGGPVNPTTIHVSNTGNNFFKQ
ncbi:Serpentine Receptor, class J [Caenorhabditis elegans]|uniref:Serpentine Receptor, class J n=1 Tax=Caenorhabditis elegans TaxID=6239 RepID=Q9NA41_CAEEL|nr:Serpentine Receptor, class J [Caenorhabditis elegans]CAB70222.4 Serpentine Receptor, class J [Caenorhabditis elegans]|eukprot:NP_502840.4 Serpentine Receptor, class J [Caenorhabditis elegans]